MISSQEKSPPYVIACGDEGVQINHGRRLAFVGSGFQLAGFSEVVTILKKIFPSKIVLVANQQSDWFKKKLNFTSWKQVDKEAQLHVAQLAKQEALLYAGFIPFSDPENLKYAIKGHMVRPKDIHVANKIVFTLAGGEQTFNLGCYQISADWVSQAPLKLVKLVINEQINFYQDLAGKKLIFIFEEAGDLGSKQAQKNKRVLEKIGIK